MTRPSTPWWRHAVIYEVYLRSFADGNGDGNGDLAGLRARLPYLADLGVDGLWIAPWYPSPMADGGYDITDFTDIHPMFGTLPDAEELIAEAHQFGLKIIIDIVANHTSDQHPWFQAAVASPPGSPQRDRYFFRDGTGQDGSLPPNNWVSAFGGPAWSRITEPDGRPGQWYLHLFAPEQPDVNWSHPDVIAAFDHVLRFWLDRGVDGLRIDAAAALAKRPGLPDADYGGDHRFRAVEWTDNPHWDVDTVHSILRRWRALADGYPGDRCFVAEAVVNGADRLSNYLQHDEMHTAFNFPYLKAPWHPAHIRSVIDDTVRALEPTGAPATWVLSSHDEVRLVTRYGRATTSSVDLAEGQGEPADLDLGTRRARAALLLMLALPGSAYLYQGEELGLPHVEDLPDELLQDPMFRRTQGAVRGRDGARVPLPWAGAVPPFGFTANGASPWLPQPREWSTLTVQAQLADPGSALSLYREALRIRREVPAFADGSFAWRDSPAEVLVFDRGEDLRCIVNFGDDAVPVPAGLRVLLSSGPLADGRIAIDHAVWLAR